MKKLFFILSFLLLMGSSTFAQKVSLINPSLDKANKFFDAGLYKEAIAEYSKTIYIEPSFMQAYNNRGLAKLWTLLSAMRPTTGGHDGKPWGRRAIFGRGEHDFHRCAAAQRCRHLAAYSGCDPALANRSADAR
jgi:hypothetical protein